MVKRQPLDLVTWGLSHLRLWRFNENSCCRLITYTRRRREKILTWGENYAKNYADPRITPFLIEIFILHLLENSGSGGSSPFHPCRRVCLQNIKCETESRSYWSLRLSGWPKGVFTINTFVVGPIETQLYWETAYGPLRLFLESHSRSLSPPSSSNNGMKPYHPFLVMLGIILCGD